MQQRFGDWLLDIDITQTMIYSAEEAAAHCTCGFCRNYYSAIDKHYPNLQKFLGLFGLDVEAPDEMISFAAGSEVWYEMCFAVCGSILATGSGYFDVDGARFSIHKENIRNINHGCPQPCFYVVIEGITLPWLLDEPLENGEGQVKRSLVLDRLFSKWHSQDT